MNNLNDTAAMFSGSGNTAPVRIALGRRESDLWLGKMLSEVLKAVSNKTEQVKLAVTQPKTRRPRRTKLQLRQAFKLALADVQQQFPKWHSKRQRTRAKALVRGYKY